MLARMLILLAGAFFIISGIMFMAAEFPVSIIDLLLIALGMSLILLSIFCSRKLLFVVISILAGLLVIITAAAVFTNLEAALLARIHYCSGLFF